MDGIDKAVKSVIPEKFIQILPALTDEELEDHESSAVVAYVKEALDVVRYKSVMPA